MSRSECKKIKDDTLDILGRLYKDHPSIFNTIVYNPQNVREILTAKKDTIFEGEVRIISSGTVEAAVLLKSEGKDEIAFLNFASAKNPGGGFLNGQPRGQEEDICRKTGLYPCIAGKEIYELARNNSRRCLYHDFVIFSPKVPIIKDENFELLEEPFEASIISCPAPNAREARKKGVSTKIISNVMQQRIDAVLSVAQMQGVKHLILGSWGTGCFGNDVKNVANAFAWSLGKYNFESVVFAIYGDKDKEIFAEVFS